MASPKTAVPTKPRAAHISERPVLRWESRPSDEPEAKFTIRLVSALGETIGTLDFTEHQHIPYIEWIGVLPAYARKGHATHMLAALQARYPQSEINWGFMTEAGRALQRSRPTRRLPTEYAPSFARLRRLQSRLAEMRADILVKENAGDDPQAEIRAYECLARHSEALECRLDRKRSHITVLDLGAHHPTPVPLASCEAPLIFRPLQNKDL